MPHLGLVSGFPLTSDINAMKTRSQKLLISNVECESGYMFRKQISFNFIKYYLIGGKIEFYASAASPVAL